MKRFCLALVLPIFISPALAAEEQVEATEPPLIVDGETADLSEYLWTNRPVIVFSDSPADPRYVQQLELLNALPDDLRDRDVIVLTDANPEAKSDLRKKLRPRSFMMVLMSKDGTVYLRKPVPWSVREISRSIDKLPSRQQEVRDRREAATQ